MNFANVLPASFRPWYQAARPRSLPATYAPLFAGGAVAMVDGVFDGWRFILALIGALLLQVASNFINEYVDHRRGTDVHKTDGMGMVLSRGQLTTGQVLAGAVFSVVSGALIGIYLVTQSGPTLLWVGLFGVLVVILYTAGPLPLSYIGLGELAVFVAMGPLMTFGTYYAVSGGRESLNAVLAGLPLAFPVAAILHANNMRDIEADRKAGKMTLAVRFGLHGARLEYQILMYGAYVMTIVLVLLGALPWPTLLVWATLPGAVKVVRQAITTDDPQVLHRVQGMTALVHWRIGLALTAGWLLFAQMIRLAP